MSNIRRPIEAYLEYLLLLIVTLECNSMFTSAAQTAGNTSLFTVFYGLALLIAGALVVPRLVAEGKRPGALAAHAAVLAALLACVAAFYLLNVRGMDAAAKRNYLLNFPLLLPLLTLLFRLKRREGKPFDLLYKQSDVACALAAMGLVVWLASVARPDAMPSDVIYSRWGGRSRITAQANLLDVCQFVTGSKWQVFGIALLRNRGLFAEPLMFALPLALALFTELFLRPKDDPWRPYRWALLSAALVMVNATIGLMLLALAWAVKGFSACLEAGKRRLIIPIVLAVVCALGVLYMEKDRLTFDDTEVSGSSLSVHIDDYRVSLRAFREHPLTGAGYQNEDALRTYMSAWRLKQNAGLSNTVGVVLAEGGVALAALCLLPLGLALLYLFRGRDRRVGYWAIGPLTAMFGIIFVYRQLLILLMAFGFSLIEVGDAERFSLKLSLADTGEAAPVRRCSIGARRATGLRAAACVAVCGALVAFGGPLWRALHAFLRGHQFSVGQSPLRAFCFGAALLLNGVFVQLAAWRALSWKRVAALAVWDGAYLLAYGFVCSWIYTTLGLLGVGSELPECLALLLIYFAGAALAAFAAPRRWLNRRGAALGVVAAALLCLIGFGSAGLMNRSAARADDLAPALQALTEMASGPVYVDELPLLYRRRVPGLSLAATHGTGYDVCESASVVFPRGTDSRELLDAGFELAELTDDALIYTNDPAVADTLRESGATLYRYYPFETPVDLGALAEENGLDVAEDGALAVEGPQASLEAGPGDTLLKGTYTARYALRIDPARYAGLKEKTLVCRLAVTRNDGEDELGHKKVTVGSFDASGRAVVEVPFKMGAASDGVEYRIEAQEGCPVEAEGIALRESPDHITVTDYNCHRDPVREAYYALDGAPYLNAKGYAALERDYDAADRVKAVRYYGPDGQPGLYRGMYFEARYRYNRQGKRVWEEYRGADGAPILLEGGYAAVGTEYDAYGNPCVRRYYDAEGSLTVTRSGYAELRQTYDGKKRVVREAYFGADGEPAWRAEGYCALEQTYDDAGNVASRRYLGADGMPVVTANGYAEVRYLYDERGKVVRESYYGPQGEPAAQGKGYAIVEWEYDENGKLTFTRCYDLAGQLVKEKKKKKS